MQERKELIIEISSNIPSKITERYFIKNQKDLYDQIIEHCDKSLIKSHLKFKDKIWLWVNNENDLPRCLCGNLTKMYSSWQDGYRRNCSVKCSSVDSIRIKNAKKSTKEKWGDSSYFKSQDYLEKIKSINIEKWGVDHYSKTDEWKEKVKKKNIEKWGVDHHSKTDEWKEMIKQNSIEKWGVDNYSKTDEWNLKTKNTSLEKWGVDNYSKTDECKDKTQKTNIKRYNSPYYITTDDFKIKSKNSSLEKWGVDHYSKTTEFKERVKTSFIEKWGVDHYTKTDNWKKNKKKHYTLNEYFRTNQYKISKDENYVKYVGQNINLFNCDCGSNHQFQILCTTYNSRFKSGSPLCTVCYPISETSSFKEIELLEFIKRNYSGECIERWRSKYEIDIYLPELKMGFEYNGLWWHSDNFLEKNYHLKKLNYFKDIGIRIVNIWEDDWIHKKEIIKSQIINLIGNTKNNIFARKCQIKELTDVKLVRDFIDSNHIQGFTNSSKKIGLYYKNELVSIMTFDNLEGRKRMEIGNWNINRFCNKINTNVVGGASKLLSYFIKKYGPKRIISYADKDWSNGKLYDKLGFEKVSDTVPDYKYIVNKKRVHKSNFKKSKLMSNLSESEEMKNKGINKVWDCGKIKFQLLLEN
jgi:hypothetical protein